MAAPRKSRFADTFVRRTSSTSVCHRTFPGNQNHELLSPVGPREPCRDLGLDMLAERINVWLRRRTGQADARQLYLLLRLAPGQVRGVPLVEHRHLEAAFSLRQNSGSPARGRKNPSTLAKDLELHRYVGRKPKRS